MEKQQNKSIQTEHYIFAPSISARKIVRGKPYYVRRIFAGDKDFERTMEQMAFKNAYKK